MPSASPCELGESVIQLAEEENGPITRPVTLAYDSFLIQHNSPLSDGADQLLYPYPVALYMAGHDIIIRGNKLQELSPPRDRARSASLPMRRISLAVLICNLRRPTLPRLIRHNGAAYGCGSLCHAKELLNAPEAAPSSPGCWGVYPSCGGRAIRPSLSLCCRGNWSLD